jgi:predicted lipoprotein with Yx(FWY)xxD motif
MMRRLTWFRLAAPRWLLFALPGAAAAGLLVAACGAAASSPTATASTGTGTSPSAGVTIKVGSATVGGSSETVLTDSSGYTLYYFVPDTPTTSRCTGSCAGYWPPVLLSSGQPTASGSLSGTLSAVQDANGRQVQYNGHFLYRYAADSAPGQAKGNGKNLSGGVWYVATPSLSAASGSGASASAKPTSSAYSGSGY